MKLLVKAFDGKLIADSWVKNLIAETLSLMPKHIIDYVTGHVWFFASTEDSYAYAFNGNDLQDQHFIFLSDDLLQQDKSQIQYTIAHEIGHIVLKHKNSVNYQQTQGEIGKQEAEADQFARYFLIQAAA